MQPQVYPDELSIRDALQIYFSKYHFQNGGYHLKWFKIKVGKLFIPLPNIKARIDAVKIHDIHHLVTEYPATLKGEAEIGAWEIASGCGKYWVAWLLNFGSLVYGLVFFPKPVYKAFMNARKCRTNCYYDTEYNDTLLNKTLGEIRTMVDINYAKNTTTDKILFIAWCIAVLSAYVVFFLMLFLAACIIIQLSK